MDSLSISSSFIGMLSIVSYQSFSDESFEEEKQENPKRIANHVPAVENPEELSINASTKEGIFSLLSR